MAKKARPQAMSPPQGPQPPRARGPSVRLLPLLIFVGVLMLSIRVSDIVRGVSGIGTVSVAELQAQQPVKSSPAPPSQAQPASATAQAPAAAAAPATAPVAADPASGMTPTELDVLQKLQERRNALDVRERDIERRESLLAAADGQIDRKIVEMKTLQNTIAGLLRQYNDQEDNKMRSLVKIYENMKPKEAAKIFEQLDMSILLEVIERMKEQRVAPIMAEMDPSKAKAVTAELAQRRQMPSLKGASGG